MTYLIDTHALLWLVDDELAIPPPMLQQLKGPKNDLFVSMASIWEIAIKRSLGKLTIRQPTQVLIDELPRIGISLLPFHHRDPFDRVIIAQALIEGCVVVSKDINFPLYSVPLLWN